MPPPTDRTPFGAHVRMLRHRKGWTQREVAERAGISIAQVSMAETARTEHLWSALIVRLADVYDADQDELFALAERVPPDLLAALRGNLANIRAARAAIM